MGGARIARRGRWRRVDVETQVGKAAEHDLVLALHPLRVERPVEGVGLAAPGAGRVHRVELEQSIAVRGEVDQAGRGGPPRLVVVPLAIREIADRARAQVELEQVACALVPERGPVGAEDDGVTVRAERRVDVLVAVRRQALEPAVAQPKTVQVGVPGERQAREDDAPAVRGPRGREDGDELGELVPPHHLVLGEVPEEQRVPVQVLAAEHHHPAGRHIHARLEEVERLELVGPLPFDHHAAPPTGQALRVDVGVAARGREVQDRIGRVAGEAIYDGLDGELGQEPRPDRERLPRGDHRVVALPHPELPLLRQLLQRPPVHRPDLFLKGRILP